MRILITGISGFSGSWLAKKLLEYGYMIVGLVHDIDPRSPLKLAGLEGPAYVQGDVLNYDQLKRIVGDWQIERIHHLAAITIVKVGQEIPRETILTNVIGTTNILEVARHHNCQVHFTSTDKVYGESNEALDESAAVYGKGPYEASKASADLIAMAYARVYGLPIVVTRSSNLYGPYDTNRRIIPNVIRQCLSGNQPSVYMGSQTTREYTYVEDAVRAYIFLMERLSQTSGKAFNVGSGEVATEYEIVREIAKHFEISPVESRPPEYMKHELTVQKINSDKLRALGWKPETCLRDGIKATVDWWKQNWSYLR
jgi:CDP-glucose 4,6-dehydratase